MAVPTNQDATTAIDVGTLPASISQDVHDTGTGLTYTVWYSYTATYSGVLGIFGFGNLTGYAPRNLVFLGPASGPVPYLSLAADNVPMQLPVSSGVTYYFRFVKGVGNPNPAILTLTAYVAPVGATSEGSILINDETDGYPAAIISGTDGTVRRFLNPFAAGESGDVLPSGAMLFEDEGNVQLVRYSANGALAGTVAFTWVGGHPPIRTHVSSSKWYVASPGSGGTMCSVRTVLAGGTFGPDTWTPTTTAVHAIAANEDESLLYYCVDAAPGNHAIKSWTLATDTAGSDLLAGVAAYVTHDILVLGTDSVIVSYVQLAGSHRDAYIVNVDESGALLHTYALGDVGTAGPRLAYGLTTSTFWVFIQNSATQGVGSVQEIRVSDGVVLTNLPVTFFNEGEYAGAQTATPIDDFGVSSSCPFILMRGSIPTSTTYPIRRQRRFLLPSSPDNKRVQIPTLELLMRTGIGLLPDAWGGSTPLGAEPQVMFRISKDGGKTWSNERWRTAGEIGHYMNRVRLLRATGQYRNAVLEVTVSDPVDWQFVAMLGEPVEGSS